MQKIIAVDLDDVLSATAEGFIEHSNRLWGHSLSRDDYQDEWAKLWGVPLEEAIQRSKLLFSDVSYIAEYTCIEHALPVLRKLAARYRLMVLTSRRNTLKEVTETWLDKHFPKIFSEVIFTGIWDSDDHVHAQLHKSKADICKQLGVDYLIDDQLKHCFGAAQAGIACLLFGDCGWNKTNKALPARVVRVYDWKEVEEYFDA